VALRKTKIQRTGQILYRILPADAFSKEQKEIVDAMVRHIPTGEDAERIAGTNGWGYQKVYPTQGGRFDKTTIVPGSVGILSFSGVEVALFYKRLTISVHSEECDPIPPYAIKDPKEAWVRIEFLHSRSSVDRTTWYSERENEYASTIKQLQGLNKGLTLENEILVNRMTNAERKLDESTETIKRLKDRMKKALDNVAALSAKNDQLQKDLDSFFKAATKGKSNKKAMSREASVKHTQWLLKTRKKAKAKK